MELLQERKTKSETDPVEINSVEYTEKIIKSEADVTKMHIVLVLKGLELVRAIAYDCPNIRQAYKDRLDVHGRYARLDVDVKRNDDWSDDQYIQEVYKATSSAWLSTLDQIWSTQNMIITTPILSLAMDEYLQHIYRQINKWPFFAAMLRPDSECILSVLSTMDHLGNY